MADKVITLGKEGGIHSRRQALVLVNDKKVVDKAFDDLSKRFADRSGGYTRVLKLGPRKGDAAPMAIIELVK
jgi:large subunit ribosomal protein L17